MQPQDAAATQAPPLATKPGRHAQPSTHGSPEQLAGAAAGLQEGGQAGPQSS